MCFTYIYTHTHREALRGNVVVASPGAYRAGFLLPAVQILGSMVSSPPREASQIRVLSTAWESSKHSSTVLSNQGQCVEIRVVDHTVRSRKRKTG